MLWYKLNPDKTVETCTLEESAMDHNKNRIVMQETLVGCLVSTIFLGFDHRYDDGPPILFETMLFYENDMEEYQKRCSTYAEALVMHQKAKDYVMKTLAPCLDVFLEDQDS